MADPKTLSINFQGELFKPQTLTPQIRKAAETTLRRGLTAVKLRTPVDTGKLRQSWTGELSSNGLVLENPTPYSTYVEMGTYRMPARPMVGNVYPRMVRWFQDELAKEVGRKLAKEQQGTLSPDYVSVATEPKGTEGANKKYNALTSRVKTTGKGFRNKLNKRTLDNARDALSNAPARAR